MRPPRQAIVLAAGFGSRLAPLTRQIPKPLLPIWGRSCLDRVLDALGAWGVEEALINLHHGAAEILEHCRTGPRATPRLAFSFEPDILGTGGALRRAAWFLDRSPFWIVNADIVADLDPRPLLGAFARRRPLAALWMHDREGPRTVEVVGSRVVNFRSPRPRSTGTFTFCGLHLVSPDVMDFIPPGASSIVAAYEAAMHRGREVLGVCPPRTFWADVGTPDRYLAVHAGTMRAARSGGPGAGLCPPEARRRRGAAGAGFAAVAPTARVEPGAVVEDSVILDGARVGRGARLRRAIVAPGVRVRGALTGLAMAAAALDDPVLAGALRALHWPLAGTLALPFSPRGSARVFTRLIRGRRRAIYVRYSLERPENALYARNAACLRRAGLSVPRVLLDRPDSRATVLEDLGDAHLLDLVLRRGAARAAPLYAATLDAVARLHSRGTAEARRSRLALAPAFDADLFRWEHELFAGRLLLRRRGWSARRVQALRRELGVLIPILLAQPRVLLHRDLQSSNVLFRRGAPHLIDFQGMRFGPAAYDLASLLCDPYVSLPEPRVRDGLAHYARRAGIPAARLEEAFWPAAVQRLVQALGAYARLAASEDTARFAAYLAPGLRMLRRALSHGPDLPGLRAAVDQLMREEGAA